jgi:hypothetical protein
MKSPGKAFWRRLGGSLLVGLVVGPPLDIACQLLVFRGDIDRTYPPVFGFVAGSLVIFSFWNRLARIELRGLSRSGAIGTVIGMAAGVILGAAVYPPLREAFGPKDNLLFPEEARESNQSHGAFLGLAVGGILGAMAGGLSYLIRLPGDQRNLIRPQEPVAPDRAGGEGVKKEPS